MISKHISTGHCTLNCAKNIVKYICCTFLLKLKDGIYTDKIYFTEQQVQVFFIDFRSSSYFTFFCHSLCHKSIRHFIIFSNFCRVFTWKSSCKLVCIIAVRTYFYKLHFLTPNNMNYYLGDSRYSRLYSGHLSAEVEE